MLTRFFALALVSAVAFSAFSSCSGKEKERERIQAEISVARDSMEFYRKMYDSLVDQKIPGEIKPGETIRDATNRMKRGSSAMDRIKYFSSFRDSLERELKSLPPE